MQFVVDSDIAIKLKSCSKCGRCASVGKVKISKEKGTLCGRCSGGQKGATSKFNLLAQCALFPCINRLEGCAQLLLSSEIIEHEKKCLSRHFECEYPDCFFGGSAMQLRAHFGAKHKRNFIDTSEIIANVNTEFAIVYMYQKYDQVFYISIAYSRKEKAIKCFVKSIHLNMLVPVAIQLKTIQGIIKYISEKKNATVLVDISKVPFPRGVILINFDIKVEKTCLYKSVELPKTSISQLIKKPAKCLIRDIVAVGGHSSFSLHISNIGNFMESLSSDRYKMLKKIWSFKIETSCLNGGTDMYLTVTVTCTPQEPVVTAHFEIELLLTSNISNDIKIQESWSIESTRNILINLGRYSHILDPANGFIFNDQLIIKMDIRQYVLPPVIEKTVDSKLASCNIIHIDDYGDSAIFAFAITNFTHSIGNFDLVSEKQSAVDAVWWITVESKYFDNKERALTLTISCTSKDPISKAHFDISLVLSSSGSSYLDIVKSQSCTVDGTKTAHCVFENLVKYSEIFYSTNKFISNDKLIFTVNLRKHMSQSIVPECRIVDSDEIDDENSVISFVVMNFNKASGITVPLVSTNCLLMNSIWWITVEDNAKTFVTLTISCKPIQPVSNVSFNITLILSSFVSSDLNVCKTESCTVNDTEITHCIFKNFTRYSEIEDSSKGRLSGNKLMLTASLKRHILQPVLSTASNLKSSLCKIVDIEEIDESNSIFSIVIANFRKEYETCFFCSEKRKAMNKMWSITVKPSYSNNKKFVTLDVLSAPLEPSRKEHYQISIILISNISNKMNIRATKTCVIGGADRTLCTFKNFVSHSNLIKKDFNVNSTVTFAMEVSRVVMPVQEAVTFNCSFNVSGKTEEKQSPHFTSQQMLWSVIVDFGLTRNSDTFSVWLHCAPEMPDVNWSCSADVTFILTGTHENISKSMTHVFHRGEPKKGFSSFASTDVILRKTSGFIQDDCINMQVLLKASLPKFHARKAANST